ncbi:MAG: 8-oxo-dGTP diphosphatase [Ilumatobacter fluminis]|uniref:8-oxo-dGTP diphosphatase n=1 Tax=Ilumatobacter fluminis TaxID=467091 RepID=UPI0032EF86E1
MTRSVADVDWAIWEPNIRATLLFVIRDDQVLLIHKKRGIGAGKINGPGGKIDPGETAMECAVRETQEELHVTATGVAEAGRLWFDFFDGTKIHCIVFRADGFDGEPTETDEAVPLWFSVDDVPFDRMWQDDELWFPSLLNRVPFELKATFDDDHLLDAQLSVG